ncbi:uncharacterized protein LOC143211682 [Lasioglossum baleicum]|uniref:uncharacterized protein LOC143211682 n=1 Tax=Lasioglossum baleicum TaxID=434251 RepID=UPI003FCCF26B
MQPGTSRQADPMASARGTAADEQEDAGKKMDRMRKWACTTDGKDPFRFLERIGELAHSYHISDAELLEGVPELLRGDAQDSNRNNRYQISTWEEFTADFLMVYAGNKTPVKREREARARVQKPGEPFHEYMNALTTLMRRALIPTDEYLETIYENMLPDYTAIIDPESISSIRDLLRHVQRIERAMERKNQAQRTASRPLAAATTENRDHIPSQHRTEPIEVRLAQLSNTPRGEGDTCAIQGDNTNNYSRVTHCWRCKQRGHTRFECRNAYRKFCSRCGRDGILTKECHPPGNDTRGSPQTGERRPQT